MKQSEIMLTTFANKSFLFHGLFDNKKPRSLVFSLSVSWTRFRLTRLTSLTRPSLLSNNFHGIKRLPKIKNSYFLLLNCSFCERTKKLFSILRFAKKRIFKVTWHPLKTSKIGLRRKKTPCGGSPRLILRAGGHFKTTWI